MQKIDVKKTFGVNSNLDVSGFKQSGEHVPAIDDSYVFDEATTNAILAGFANNKRVLIQGFHGTGKSTHIEQVAARLNWGCVRINLDSQISRIDLIGRDAIVVEDGKQVTKFVEGLLPYCIRRPIALVLDEYDAARPDVMFVIQRLLEAHGKFTLLDANEVIDPHEHFRIFATANTVGMGDSSGIYHGTQNINQGQMDRWNLVAKLNYLDEKTEEKIVWAKVPEADKELIKQMIALANLVRGGFLGGDITSTMSPRAVINWAENAQLFGDVQEAFKISYLNKCDESEHEIIAEYYQRVFDAELLDVAA